MYVEDDKLGRNAFYGHHFRKIFLASENLFVGGFCASSLPEKNANEGDGSQLGATCLLSFWDIGGIVPREPITSSFFESERSDEQINGADEMSECYQKELRRKLKCRTSSVLQGETVS